MPAEHEPDVVVEILAGDGLTLSQAARTFPQGRKSRRTDQPAPVNPSTLFRWHKYGVRLSSGVRVHLEAARVGNRLLTSRAALARFVRAQQPDAPAQPAHVATPAQRRRAHEKAE